MTKKHISLIILIAMLIAMLGGCATPKIAVCARGVGSVCYVTGVTAADTPLSIKELNINAVANYFSFDDYVIDPNGQTYTIINAKRKKLCEIKLLKKAEISGRKLDIVLSEYNETYLSIESNVKEVHIIGDSSPHEMYINIEERTTPIDIHLDNAFLYTEYSVPVIFNGNNIAVNIKLTGDNVIQAGSRMPERDLIDEDYLNWANREISAFLHDTTNDVLDIAIPNLYRFYVDCCKFASNVDERMNSNNSPAYSAIASEIADRVGEFNGSLINGIDAGLSVANDFFFGNRGSDGADGATAIALCGDLAIYGDGELIVTGGDGENGADSYGYIDSQPGRGGDGGRPICAITVILYRPIITKSGTPGNGGTGHNIVETTVGSEGKYRDSYCYQWYENKYVEGYSDTN